VVEKWIVLLQNWSTLPCIHPQAMSLLWHNTLGEKHLGVLSPTIICINASNFTTSIEGTLDPRPQIVFMRISKVFWRICNKMWNPLEIKSLQLNVSISLALLEMYFPPLFFDIMTHLLYHLVDELDVCGLVITRWMYPIKKYMKTLKLYVHNMAWLEASMAKGYIQDECIGFIF